jgi:hypothetical protein
MRMPTAIEQLTSTDDTHKLGHAFIVNNMALVMDVPSPLIAGMPVHFSVFNTPDNSILEVSPGGSTRKIYSVIMSQPGFVKTTFRVRRTGQDLANFDLKLDVLRSTPRVQVAAAEGTPESDSLQFLYFVYAYRDYIIKAAQATGWPNQGICPRLIAAIIYREFVRTDFVGGVPEDPGRTLFRTERMGFTTVVESISTSSPNQFRQLSWWDTPLGFGRLPLYLLMAAHDPVPFLQDIFHAVYNKSEVRSNLRSWVIPSLSVEAELLLQGNLGSILPQDVSKVVELTNFARFPRSNILYTAKILHELKQFNFGVSLQPDANTLTGIWAPGAKISDSDLNNPAQENELLFLLTAFERLRSIAQIRRVTHNPFGPEVLRFARLPLMDFYFNIQEDYGGYALLENDSDNTHQYAGDVRPATVPAQTHVANLITDLRQLGFGTAGRRLNGSGNGQTVQNAAQELQEPTDWAIRELQIFAGMERIAGVDAAHNNTAMTDQNYDTYLSSVEPNPIRYLGPISGVANIETRALIQYWKRQRYRCPVIVSARRRNNPASEDWPLVDAMSLWFRQGFTDTPDATRMFMTDFTGYYLDYKTVDETFPNRADNRTVVGSYHCERQPKPNQAQCASKGGPVVLAQFHSWPEARITCTKLTPTPMTLVSPTPPPVSTMRVVLAVGMVEAQEHFDVVNAWDGGVISVGLCHWTLWFEEMGAYLAYFKRENRKEFNILFRRFGIDVPDWNPRPIASGGMYTELKTYNTKPYRANEFDTNMVLHWETDRLRTDFDQSWPDNDIPLNRRVKQLPNNEESWFVTQGGVRDGTQRREYFRTWPYFYRFVMAGRAGKAYRAKMWDMARIRLRDLFAVTWETNSASGDYYHINDPVTNVSRPATIGDIFSSEMAFALIYRWHVNWPVKLIDNDQASEHLKTLFRQVLNTAANHAIFFDGAKVRQDVATWNYPANEERVLVDGIIQYVTANETVSSSWKNLMNSMNGVHNGVAHTEQDGAGNITLNLGTLSYTRFSFQLDMTGLPPAP